MTVNVTVAVIKALARFGTSTAGSGPAGPAGLAEGLDEALRMVDQLESPGLSESDQLEDPGLSVFSSAAAVEPVRPPPPLRAPVTGTFSPSLCPSLPALGATPTFRVILEGSALNSFLLPSTRRGASE